MKIDCQAAGRIAAAAHDAYVEAMASAEYWASAGDLQLADRCVDIANRHELNAAHYCNLLVAHWALDW